MDSRIPLILHPLIREFTRQLDQELPGFIHAFYLVGSIALDSFNPQHSDIDFVAVLYRRALSQDITGLVKIHQAVGKHFPKWKMSGMYLQAADLGRLENDPEPFPAYHDGKIKWTRQFELNPVTWWILKNRGIPVIDPSSQDLPFTVDWNGLISWMHGNLNSYWVSWTVRPARILALLSDYSIQWAVLGVLRQFYTFRENQITSKTKAGEHALVCLPNHRHQITQEAIAIREGSKIS
jgi:hypothetical protein